MLARLSIWMRTALQRIQSRLAFENWHDYPQFNNKQGLGRVALIGCLLGLFWGIHFLCFVQLSLIQLGLLTLPAEIDAFLGSERVQLILQWCFYVVIVCTFHSCEFFATALYNPKETSSDAFLINHSVAYTAAALVRSSVLHLKRFLDGT
jgi:hypothetical protein